MYYTPEDYFPAGTPHCSRYPLEMCVGCGDCRNDPITSSRSGEFCSSHAVERTARKVHTCCECELPISIGERYINLRYFSKWIDDDDDEPGIDHWNGYIHIACHEKYKKGVGTE